MTDDSKLRDFDPFDVLDREAVRLDAYFSTLRDGEWAAPSRCPAWTTRDMLGHLAASERYHHACLDGTVAEFMAEVAAAGARDFNQMGVDNLAQFTPQEVLGMWRVANLETRHGFRERGDGTIDTSAGEYPCRWQAFHIASELATHADDVYVPIADDEDELRWAWRVGFSWFALSEAKPEVIVEQIGEGRIRVAGDDVEVEVNEHDL